MKFQENWSISFKVMKVQNQNEKTYDDQISIR